MKTFDALTIVTSCRNYGVYLQEWATSIASQTMRPGAVCIFTHGQSGDQIRGERAAQILSRSNIFVTHVHSKESLDFGVARNAAVDLAKTDWVMHLDADDTLLPHAVATFETLAPSADVISAGYILSGRVNGAATRRERVYQNADGLKALDLRAICSGISPFRKSFWTQSPYRTDMMGAWDTALWIGFAKLGARFRATPRAVFRYNQHDDSIFNQRRRVLGWTRALTQAQLKALRRSYEGVAIVVPQSQTLSPDRAHVWQRVRAHYERHHPEWPILIGKCPTPVWVKGAAIAQALGSSRADCLVIADADCIVDPEALRTTVNRVLSGSPWGMPHHLVYRADKGMTMRYCAESADILPVLPDRHSVDRDPYEGAPGGGIVVIRRVYYEAIGGIPHVFRGWGSEDRALACLANTLIGPCDRGDADLLHLYHTPQATMQQPQANLQLLRQLGQAALNGKDALVAFALTLPNPATNVGLRQTVAPRPNHGTSRPIVVEHPALINARRRMR